MNSTMTDEEKEEQLYPFTLVIPALSWKKIMEYTIACSLEISQFADITFDPDEKTFTIGEVYLLPQRASAVETVMEEEDVSQFMDECMKSGKKELPRCWVHSHVDMEVFFSPTDIDTYEKTLNNKAWMVALVVNKLGEHKAVLQQYVPFPFTWELDVQIEYPHHDIPKEVYKEISQKVKRTKSFMDSLFFGKRKEKVPDQDCDILPAERFARTKFIEDNGLYKIQHATLGWVWTDDEGNIWKDAVN